MATTRQDAINDALERLYDLGFTVDPGFAAHGPMVVETISTLGRDDAVTGWLDLYLAKWRHRPLPPSQAPIDETDERLWRVALGERTRMADWLDFFRRALAERPWPEVLRTWAPRLIDGAAGGLNHGLIRTAHAVRTFPDGGAPSALEIDELARGLAYWAGSYRLVPGDPDAHGALALSDALDRLPRFPAEARGSFALDGLAGLPGFAATVESLAAAPDVDAAVSAHTAIFARMLIAHQELRQVQLIELIHAITGPSAMRILLPYMPGDFGAWAYRRLWRVSAAIVADVAGPLPAETDPEIGEPTLAVDELVARAVAHKDEHVIKLTEALLREDRIRPDPAYRVAAESVFSRIRPWK